MGSPQPLTTDQRRRLVRALHDGPTMLVLAVAGGGNAVILDLLDMGGASRTVLEIVVPYAESAMVDLVGPIPEGRPLVSDEQAEAMARAALARARTLINDAATPVVGVAITAALASDRPKRGDHRAHLALAGEPRGETGATPGAGAGVPVVGRELRLVKGELDRAGEDRLVADAALSLMAEVCGLRAPAEPEI